MSIQGNVSAVKAGAIWGYAFDDGDAQPVEVFLYINGEPVASTRADIFRQGVLDHGLHPTGSCGFTFSMAEHKLFLPAGAKVQVKVGPERVEITGSPAFFENEEAMPTTRVAAGKRILIVGLPKSGTSILTYRVAAGLPGAHICFEPGGKETLFDAAFHQKLTQQHERLVTKCLFIPLVSKRVKLIANLYHKKIWIYRDIRDRIISDFFFRWRKKILELPEWDLRELIEKIIHKENSPQSIPFYSLMPHDQINDLDFIVSGTIEQANYLDDSWYGLSYEELIDGRLDDLNKYLGFPVDGQAEIKGNFQRVARSKKAENWRKWFTAEDVAFFKPLLTDYLIHFGYAPQDWELRIPDTLPASEGSDYIKKLVSEVLTQQGKEIPPYLQ